MESEGSLPHSQKPTTRAYREKQIQSTSSHPVCWRSILILSCRIETWNQNIVNDAETFRLPEGSLTFWSLVHLNSVPTSQ
jgi:hypothetical protein